MSQSGYIPVDYTYREAVEEAILRQQNGRIFYFDDNQRLESADGRIVKLEETGQGWMLTLHTGVQIKLHRLITLFGKPGPAYDEYDNYSIRCAECLDENQPGAK